MEIEMLLCGLPYFLIGSILLIAIVYTLGFICNLISYGFDNLSFDILSNLLAGFCVILAIVSLISLHAICIDIGRFFCS